MSTRKPRAATTTLKAKKAATIAASESKDSESQTQPKRKPGRPKKKKDAAPPPEKDELDSDDDEETPEDEKEGGADIDWTKDLVWTLITAIEEDEDIRRGLFPPPGSTKRNGGLPKKHFQFLLAKICFEKHPQYADTFKKALAGKPRQQKLWWSKIKNKVKVLTNKTCANMEIMGQTGAGLESEKDIIPGTALSTK
ncbi:hypothetical protein FB451DRAFT_1412420 [Mycena latifolia]|nr:hypothetical protein FB451DRAFT_1412420 [Mycena latifolia]